MGQKGDYCSRKGKKNPRQAAATLSCGVLVKQQDNAFQDGCQKQLGAKSCSVKQRSVILQLFPLSEKRERKKNMTLQKTPDVITVWKIDETAANVI